MTKIAAVAATLSLVAAKRELNERIQSVGERSGASQEFIDKVKETGDSILALGVESLEELESQIEDQFTTESQQMYNAALMADKAGDTRDSGTAALLSLLASMNGGDDDEDDTDNEDNEDMILDG